MDVQHLAAELTPPARSELERMRPEIIAAAGGYAKRHAVGLAWPLIIWVLPWAIRIGLALFAWKFGDLKIGDLFETLFSIRRETPHAAVALGRNPTDARPAAYHSTEGT